MRCDSGCAASTEKVPAAAPIDNGQARPVLIDLVLPTETRPNGLRHHIEWQPAAPDGVPPTVELLTAAPIGLLGEAAVIGAPLAGDRWVALNGCCAPDSPHRETVLPVNGGPHFAQRFAIDWIRLDEQGRLATGDPTELASYPA